MLVLYGILRPTGLRDHIHNLLKLVLRLVLGLGIELTPYSAYCVSLGGS